MDKIKSVTKYDDKKSISYSVKYNSRRVDLYIGRPIPQTVRNFIARKTPHEHYDQMIECTVCVYE